jgi:hypothetical protein
MAESVREELLKALENAFSKTYDPNITDVICMINACNNFGDIDVLGITSRIKRITSTYSQSHDRETRLLMTQITKMLGRDPEEIVINCPCGNIVNQFERQCSECGEEVLTGIQRQEQSRTKWDNTSQHFEETLDSLEGKDRIKISREHELEIYKKVIEVYGDRDGKMFDISDMDLVIVRNILRSLGMSGYYRNLQTIRIKIFNNFGVVKDFPRFMNQERDLLRYLFEKCFSAFNIVKVDTELLESINRNKIENIIFYPFLIKKLLPRIMTKERAREFDCLFISQSPDATDKHRKIWNKMLGVMNLQPKYECLDIKFY